MPGVRSVFAPLDHDDGEVDTGLAATRVEPHHIGAEHVRSWRQHRGGAGAYRRAHAGFGEEHPKPWDLLRRRQTPPNVLIMLNLFPPPRTSLRR